MAGQPGREAKLVAGIENAETAANAVELAKEWRATRENEEAVRVETRRAAYIVKRGRGRSICYLWDV